MTSYGLVQWFWAMLEPIWTWPHLTFGQLFMWIGTNNDQIWLSKVQKLVNNAHWSASGWHHILSSNLGTGMTSGDYAFKHTEADTILLFAYAKLRTQHYTGSLVIDSEDTDVYVQATSADKTQACIHQVPIHASRRGCRHNHTSPRHHWPWPHFGVLWSWQKASVREGDDGSWGERAPGKSRWESGDGGWRQSWYWRRVSSLIIYGTCYLRAGQSFQVA